MDTSRKTARYKRIYDQLVALMTKTTDPDARMATMIALLHHKMNYYFWTGFYFLRDGELTVKTYQGPLACQVLKKHTGVCWAGVDRQETIIVEDVEQFPGHIACDSRSRSEIVIPVRNENGTIVGVLDVDSKDIGSFDKIDAEWLEKIVELIYPRESHPS